MTNTTQEQIDLAKLIAQQITEEAKQFGLGECIVDDWGRFGNFSLIAYLDVMHKWKGYKPNDGQKFDMKKIVAVIKKVVHKFKDKGAVLRAHESPKGKYTKQVVRGYVVDTQFEGYDRSYISIDLDFNTYIPGGNFFIQKETGEQMKMF